MKAKVKDYLVFIEQCDDEDIIKRMTGEKLRQYILEHGQEGICIVEGTMLKSFNVKIDITKL
jgi:hypothetical protein